MRETHMQPILYSALRWIAGLLKEIKTAARAVLALIFLISGVTGTAFSQSIQCPINSNTTISGDTTIDGTTCVVGNNAQVSIPDGNSLLNQDGITGKPTTMIIDSGASLNNSYYFQNFATTSTGYVGSTLTNFGTIYNNATGTLDTTDGTLTNAGNLENFGHVDDETGGGGTLNNAGRIVNEQSTGGGVINVTTVTNSVGATIENDSTFQASSLTNNGTFSNLAGDLALTGSSTNNGTLDNQNSFIISGQFQNNGGLTNGGFLTVVNGGSLNFGGGATLTDAGGSLVVSSGAILNNSTGSALGLPGLVVVNGTVNAGPGVYVSNGAVPGLFTTNGAGGIGGSGNVLLGTGTINGNFVNDSVVAPGSANPIQGFVLANDAFQFAGTGTLTVNGNYAQEGEGDLAIALGGVGAGTFSVLDVSGLASLGGVVQFDLFNGFTPVTGDDFTFLTAGSLSGDFADLILDGWSCPTGDVCDLVYGANSVSLDITASSSGGTGGNGGNGGNGGTTNAPEPSSSLLLVVGIAVIATLSSRKRRAVLA